MRPSDRPSIEGPFPWPPPSVAAVRRDPAPAGAQARTAAPAERPTTAERALARASEDSGAQPPVGAGAGSGHRRASSWDHTLDERLVLEEFSRATALVGPSEAAARALAERTARQGTVAQLKQALNPTSTVSKATSRVAAPPKAKHVHTLVLESWSHRTNPHFFARLLFELARRPVLASPVVALKVLLVVHKLMQQGAPETLAAVSLHGGHLLEGLRVAWPQRKAAGEMEHADLAVLIEPYAGLVKLKADFYDRFRCFDNNYAAPAGSPAAGGVPMRTQAAACELLAVLDATLSTLRLALSRLASVRARDGPNSLAAATAIALLREAHIAYDALLFLFASLAPLGLPPAPVGEWFAKAHGTLRELYDDVRAYPALAHLEPPPALSPDAPRFGIARRGSGSTPPATPRTAAQAAQAQQAPPPAQPLVRVAPPLSAEAPAAGAFWGEEEEEEEPWFEEEEDGAHGLVAGLAWTPEPQLAPPPLPPHTRVAPTAATLSTHRSLLDLEPEDWGPPTAVATLPVAAGGAGILPQAPPPPPPPPPPPMPPSMAASCSVAWPSPAAGPAAAPPLSVLLQPPQPPPRTWTTFPAAPAPAPAPAPPPMAPPMAPHLAPPPMPSQAHVAAPIAPPVPAMRPAASRPSPASASAEWQIPLEQLLMGERIGRGAFGEVVRAVYQGTDVAVKRMAAGAAAADFVREVQLLIKLRHPHVVLFMGACITPAELCIVMEFAARGSLWAVLHGKQRGECTPRRRLQWAAETAKGMAYLHSRSPPIVHRDLKSGNLLVDEDMHIKVSDFGLARTKTADGARTQVGTYAWMAPEVLEQKPYDERADVYSFSIVLWELLTALEPFKGLHPMQVMRAVDRGERPPVPPSPECPPDYVALMRQCWSKEPEDRPTFKEALQRIAAMVAWR